MNKTEKTVCFSLLVIIIFGITTLLLVDWYVNPTFKGFNLVHTYLNSTSDNVYLSMSGYDEDEIKSEFLDEIQSLSSNKLLSVDQSVEILENGIDKKQDELFDNLQAIITYQFSPFITFIAVIFLHLKFWSWVTIKIGKSLKIFPITEQQKSD